jgi:alpha-tubulin suppressor-like RCC1 family protein
MFAGSVWAWGDDTYSQLEVPVSLTNAMAISGEATYALAVRDDGTVIAWGEDELGADQTNIPSGLTNAVAVAAGDYFALALKSDGTVKGWGYDGFGDVSGADDLTGVAAIATCLGNNLALESNGTLVTWGVDGVDPPAGATNITAIATGKGFSLALSNGIVVAWGRDDYGQTDVPASATNVVAIAAGVGHGLALRSNGTVVAWGDNSAGQTNVPAGLSNVMAVAAGFQHSVALKNGGTVIVWGDNTYNQTNVLPNLPTTKLIAAGFNFTLAALFSPLVQYPVNVTNDLLLIYNTNSVDSSNVCQYYLQHRPMVSGANVLAVNVPGIFITNSPANSLYAGLTNATDYETVSPTDFSNEVLTPVTNWLAANPTKRPQYVILFLDVPSRVSACATNADYFPFYCADSIYPSVSWQLATGIPGWQPLVTHINMNGTNDCISYINKLATIGSTYSPGTLLISAPAVGYGNTNYYFDDNRDSLHYGTGPSLGGDAKSGVLDVNPSASITYAMDDTVPHITSATNVAGYFCWGAHSTLGASYPTDGTPTFYGDSGWYLINTVESFNGQRYVANFGNYTGWFSSNAFGGSSYANAPIGGVSNTDEPDVGGINSPQIYYGLWECGKNFAICAWASRYSQTNYSFVFPQAFQAVGDPFVKK